MVSLTVISGPLQLKPVSDQVGEGAPSLRLRTSDAVIRRRRHRPRGFASLCPLRGEEADGGGSGSEEENENKIFFRTLTRYHHSMIDPTRAILQMDVGRGYDFCKSGRILLTAHMVT